MDTACEITTRNVITGKESKSIQLHLHIFDGSVSESRIAFEIRSTTKLFKTKCMRHQFSSQSISDMWDDKEDCFEVINQLKGVRRMDQESLSAHLINMILNICLNGFNHSFWLEGWTTLNLISSI